MAVTFNPSITTNFKPSFTSNNNSNVPAKRANLAPVADSFVSAAKPVKPNKLKMFFAGLPFVAASIMGASCEKPIDPPIIPTDPTIDYTKTEAPKTINKMFQVLGVEGFDAKGEKQLSYLVTYDEMLHKYDILDFNYDESGFDSTTVYRKTVVKDQLDTGRSKIIIKSEPSQMRLYEYPDFGNGYLPTTNPTESYAFSADQKSIIQKHLDVPNFKIEKAAPNLVHSTIIGPNGPYPPNKIHVIDAKFVNVNKSLKQACDNAVQFAIDSAKTASKKAARTIR